MLFSGLLGICGVVVRRGVRDWEGYERGVKALIWTRTNKIREDERT
jgi:hypothetical protein